MEVKRKYLMLGAIVGGAVAGYLLLSRSRRVAAQQPQQQPSQQQPSQPSQQPPSQQSGQPPSQQQQPSKKVYETRLSVSAPEVMRVNEPFVIRCSLYAVVDSSLQPLPGLVYIYVDDQLVMPGVTDNNGTLYAQITIYKPGTHIIKVVYPGRETENAIYKPSEASTTITVVDKPAPGPVIYLDVTTPTIEFSYDDMPNNLTRRIYVTNVDFSSRPILAIVLNSSPYEHVLDINGVEIRASPAEAHGGVVIAYPQQFNIQLSPTDVITVTLKSKILTRFDFISISFVLPMVKPITKYHWECVLPDGSPVVCHAAPIIKLVIDQYA